MGRHRALCGVRLGQPGWLPEAAVIGAAAGMFASAEGPILAPLESSMAFLDAYEVSRGRTFSVEEREVAWAASIGPLSTTLAKRFSTTYLPSP
jgi:hypothetical protein